MYHLSLNNTGQWFGTWQVSAGAAPSGREAGRLKVDTSWWSMMVDHAGSTSYDFFLHILSKSNLEYFWTSLSEWRARERERAREMMPLLILMLIRMPRVSGNNLRNEGFGLSTGLSNAVTKHPRRLILIKIMADRLAQWPTRLTFHWSQ